MILFDSQPGVFALELASRYCFVHEDQKSPVGYQPSHFLKSFYVVP